jgi:hypothetical protein
MVPMRCVDNSTNIVFAINYFSLKKILILFQNNGKIKKGREEVADEI